MKKLITTAFTLFVFVGFASQASAKCYNFSDAPDDTFVCVGKDGADSFDDRKAAKKICDEKAGKSCGNVSSTSSSCHSNKNLCYDETGKAHRSLKDY